MFIEHPEWDKAQGGNKNSLIFISLPRPKLYVMRLTPVRTPVVYLFIPLFLLLFSISGFGQAPTIASFTPTTICQGEQVTIQEQILPVQLM